MFLVIKEALNNVSKHAEATEVRLGFSKHDHGLRILVEDNGRGMQLNETGKRGNGLLNMEARVRTIHGCFALQSAPAEGTRIHIDVPLATSRDVTVDRGVR
jgi:signal transduction histidine kinase